MWGTQGHVGNPLAVQAPMQMAQKLLVHMLCHSVAFAERPKELDLCPAGERPAGIQVLATRVAARPGPLRMVSTTHARLDAPVAVQPVR